MPTVEVGQLRRWAIREDVLGHPHGANGLVFRVVSLDHQPLVEDQLHIDLGPHMLGSYQPSTKLGKDQCHAPIDFVEANSELVGED